MTLEQLRTFRAVIEAGSFRAAATRLHRTQPAVTHQMKTLERELKHVLIERRTASPTPAGKLLYAQACALLSNADAMQASLRDFDELDGALRLGTSDTTAMYTLPAIVRRYRRAHPNARLHIVNRPTDGIAQMVQRGDLDLGIVTVPVRLEHIDERALFEQALVLVVPKQHPLSKRKSVRLGALESESFLLLEDATRTGKLLRDCFNRHDFRPNVVLDTSSFEVIKRYVAEGIGISFLPKTAITPHDTHIATVHVPGLPKVTIGAIWRKGAYQTRAARGFLDQVDKVFSSRASK